MTDAPLVVGDSEGGGCLLTVGQPPSAEVELSGGGGLRISALACGTGDLETQATGATLETLTPTGAVLAVFPYGTAAGSDYAGGKAA
jgi:hypothetical protein